MAGKRGRAHDAPPGDGAAPTLLRSLKDWMGWLPGMALATARYVRRPVPIHREYVEADVSEHPVRARGLPGDNRDLQRAATGVGPLFHRRYRVRLRGTDLTPERLIAAVAADPNLASPVEVARFEKERGRGGRMEVGDEYDVRMPGPWNGRVRVIARSPTSFRLATLQGHMEAGEIEFRAVALRGGYVGFQIESWARCGDRVFRVLYDRLGLSREMQLHTWVHFLERVTGVAGGRRVGGVKVSTRRQREREPAGG